MKIKIIKFEDYPEKLPNRAHYNDSGADVFAAKTITLEPHAICPVPLGIGVILPDGYDTIIHCKSGLSMKGIWAANAPVDAGYRGEIHALLINNSDKPYTFERGDKVGQLVVRPVIYADFVEDLDGNERGDGAFGSTGK